LASALGEYLLFDQAIGSKLADIGQAAGHSSDANGIQKAHHDRRRIEVPDWQPPLEDWGLQS
jgi:hypothetical protein